MDSQPDESIEMFTISDISPVVSDLINANELLQNQPSH
jgi:hypothetical protein